MRGAWSDCADAGGAHVRPILAHEDRVAAAWPQHVVLNCHAGWRLAHIKRPLLVCAEHRLAAWTLRDVHRQQLERKRLENQRQLELEIAQRHAEENFKKLLISAYKIEAESI